MAIYSIYITIDIFHRLEHFPSHHRSREETEGAVRKGRESGSLLSEGNDRNDKGKGQAIPEHQPQREHLA